ncbi:hypothetical protein QEH59_13400 [Coraliomargarita sp. SDUM461004]|uniref:YcaO domain-containing protein n=1 Tax=Thalassobacterium sedimentorum TaxID=3041258 RepID=A0ABU1ANT0_9BACT|nr:hypothetical protein [Coraliomargarita sp. SDUM461004]MDQ8195426.1 hypothetical protein [Coraliomargarita sp. SDUM461004]
MLNLAPLRYVKVMEADGGPIARLEHAYCDIFGVPCVHAVAYLKQGIVAPELLQMRVIAQPDGAGAHESAQIACYMAISEAMERWAVHYCRERLISGMGGMDLDFSSNGFAAYPGVFRRQAREAAYRESIERHCLIGWWEGLLGHRCIENPRPGVSAIIIDHRFSAHTVVLLWSMTAYGHSYSFGAGHNVAHAVQRALVELSRTQSMLKQLVKLSLPLRAGRRGDVFERRIHYFSTDEGVSLFLERLKRQVKTVRARPKVLFDSAVYGPWDAYASVWRTVFEAPSQDYLSEREDYFFW